MIKADLHLHCSADPKDLIKYSDKELINHMAQKGYDVLSITCHDLQHYNKKLASYAGKKGVLLIPGIEKTIRGKHVLLYNFKKEELKKIKEFEDIQKYKRNDNLVVCPHPFLPLSSSVLWKFKKYSHLFDAVEYCHFYTRLTNHNLITKKLTKLPLVGSSDAHFLWQTGSTHSMIDSKKEIKSVIEAIKKGKVKVHSRPLGHFEIIKNAFKIIFNGFKKKKQKVKFLKT